MQVQRSMIAQYFMFNCYLYVNCKHVATKLRLVVVCKNLYFFYTFRKIRTKTPSLILLNFCLALSLTLIVFIVAAERSKTSSASSCRAAAIALHYFVLAVFIWMAIEAYNMYLCFVKILPTGQSYFITKSMITGWGE